MPAPGGASPPSGSVADPGVPRAGGAATFCAVLAKLPGWVVDDAQSVRDEVAEWEGLTVAERWRLAQLCSRDALWAARASGRLTRILDLEDALPASSVAALARLRRAAGWGDGPR